MNQATPMEFKQAKPTQEDIDNLYAFLEAFGNILFGDPKASWSVEELQELGSDIGNWRKVVCSTQVLLENCCDPNSEALEWKPEIAKLLDAATALEEVRAESPDLSLVVS